MEELVDRARLVRDRQLSPTEEEEVYDIFRQMTNAHVREPDCSESECALCGFLDCPFEDPLHYHHDGCPSCWTAKNQNRLDEIMKQHDVERKMADLEIAEKPGDPPSRVPP